MKKMSSKSSVLKRFVRQLDLQLFAWMGIIYLIIFCFIPMLGIVIAFKDYSINSGFGGILTSDCGSEILPGICDRLSVWRAGAQHTGHQHSQDDFCFPRSNSFGSYDF